MLLQKLINSSVHNQSYRKKTRKLKKNTILLQLRRVFQTAALLVAKAPPKPRPALRSLINCNTRAKRNNSLTLKQIPLCCPLV